MKCFISYTYMVLKKLPTYIGSLVLAYLVFILVLI